MAAITLLHTQPTYHLKVVKDLVVFVPNTNTDISISIKDFVLEKALAFFKEISSLYSEGQVSNGPSVRVGFPAWEIDTRGDDQYLVIKITSDIRCILLHGFNKDNVKEQLKRLVGWVHGEYEMFKMGMISNAT